SVGKDLMTQDLADLAGKQAVVRANEYPPGTSNPPHRHNAHVFLHLLEGQLIVQVKGGQPVTLKPGDTYYESPADIHVVSRNPSATCSVARAATRPGRPTRRRRRSCWSSTATASSCARSAGTCTPGRSATRCASTAATTSGSRTRARTWWGSSLRGGGWRCCS